MEFIVFRGTARKLTSDDDSFVNCVHGWACLAYAPDFDTAVETAAANLQEAGYRAETVDRDVRRLSPWRYFRLDQLARQMRLARIHGAVVTISAEPGDPWFTS